MDRIKLGGLAANLTMQHGLAVLSAKTRKAWHKPTRVSFEICTVCNLKCLHCGIWRRKKDPEALTLSEWLRTLRELRRWIGPFMLGFRSGEPFGEPDIFPILREASALGVTTTCVSNGTLIDAKMAKRIAESGLRSLHLSLDGMNPATHDEGRGVPGTFEKVLEAVRHLKTYARPSLIRIATIIADHNLNELEALVRWTAAEKFSGISFQPLFARGDDWQRFWPEDPRTAADAIDKLIALKRRGYPVLNSEKQLAVMKLYFADPKAPHPEALCGTYTNLNIKNTGEVYLCTFKDPIGHIRRQGLAELWRSETSRERFGEILGCKEPCILLSCNFKPGLAQRAVEFVRQAN